MTEATTEIVGADALAASLHRVAGELDDMTRPGQAAGQTVKQRAASNAPVRTGALARSIYANAGPDEVQVGATARYAGYQEYGTVNTPASPYLRPALEASTGQVLEAYTNEVESLMGTVKGA